MARARLPWTKFQDFYLRLGFLKVLVALLDPQRRSVSSDVVGRRLKRLLFRPALDRPELRELLRAQHSWVLSVDDSSTVKSTSNGRAERDVAVAEALLLTQDCASQLPAVTAATTHKVLEWGRDVGFVGSGNQITEDGLLLRALLPEAKAQRFKEGSVLAWNPFIITPTERLFFLFHLCQIDHLTLEIVATLGLKAPEVLEASEASQIACRAFFKVLTENRKSVRFRDLPRFRAAHELACAMASELGLKDLQSHCGSRSVWRRPVRTRPGSGKVRRRRTKKSDHQTIPRFEQLVDLGFVTKPVGAREGPEGRYRARRRWKYQATPMCDAWSRWWRTPRSNERPWHWHNFAWAAVTVGVAGVVGSTVCNVECAGRHLWNAYGRIRRLVGHTPFQSVALLAMIEAVSQGHVVELSALHRIMMTLKRDDLLREYAFFSGGNEIDTMFILLKQGFSDAFQGRLAEIEGGWKGQA